MTRAVTSADMHLRKRTEKTLRLLDHRLCVLVWSMLSLAVLYTPATSAEPNGVQFFREKIEPVLKAQCYGCHSGETDKVQGGLRLDSRAAVLRGGESGPAVVVGKTGASPLIRAIRHEGDLAMPPKKAKLSDATIADFVKWVEMGAPDPRDGDASDDVMAGLSEGRKHWAFQPVRKANAPKVRDAAWGRSAQGLRI